MPKKGIHPVVQSVTYVLKNGASVELPSILQRAVPYTLQSVRALQSEQFSHQFHFYTRYKLIWLAFRSGPYVKSLVDW